jgi:hypothetical protein
LSFSRLGLLGFEPLSLLLRSEVRIRLVTLELVVKLRLLELHIIPESVGFDFGCHQPLRDLGGLFLFQGFLSIPSAAGLSLARILLSTHRLPNTALCWKLGVHSTRPVRP